MIWQTQPPRLKLHQQKNYHHIADYSLSASTGVNKTDHAQIR